MKDKIKTTIQWAVYIIIATPIYLALLFVSIIHVFWVYPTSYAGNRIINEVDFKEFNRRQIKLIRDYWRNWEL